MNLEKHRKSSFVLPKNLYRHINTPLLEKKHKLITEFPTNVHEIVTKKKKIEDSIAVHVSLFVYQLSTLWLYKFIYTLHEYLVPKSNRIAYIGKIGMILQNGIVYISHHFFRRH